MHRDPVQEARLHSLGLWKEIYAYDEKMFHCILFRVHLLLGNPCDTSSNCWCKGRGKVVVGGGTEAFPSVLKWRTHRGLKLPTECWLGEAGQMPSGSTPRLCVLLRRISWAKIPGEVFSFHRWTKIWNWEFKREMALYVLKRLTSLSNLVHFFL